MTGPSLSKKLLDLQPYGGWKQRRIKPYMKKTNRYSHTCRRFLECDTKTKLDQLKLSGTEFVIAPEVTFPLDGLRVRRSSIPQARLDQKVSVVNLANGKQIATGYISKLRPVDVVIRFFQPIVHERISEEDPAEQAKKPDGGEPTPRENLNCKIELDDQYIQVRHEIIDKALEKFRTIRCRTTMHKSIMGHFDDRYEDIHTNVRTMEFDNLPYPKYKMHKLAVEQSLKRRISLIEGPAGSGKTTLAAYIACNTSRLMKKKVLLCSPVQTTVVRLAKLIESVKGVRSVEMPSFGLIRPKERQFEPSTLGSSSRLLDTLVHNEMYAKSVKRARGVSEEPAHVAKCVAANASQFLLRKYRRKILKRADIVCCNLIQSGGHELRGLDFDVLIIDDVQVASEIECLVPMVLRKIKQVTLISEMRPDLRLPKRPESLNQAKDLDSLDIIEVKSNALLPSPSYLSRQRDTEVADRLTGQPGGLFERFVSIGHSSVALRHQFRAHESLANISNPKFYRRAPAIDYNTNFVLDQRLQECWQSTDGDAFDWLPKPRCMTALFLSQPVDGGIFENLNKMVNNLVYKENIEPSQVCIIANCRADFLQPDEIEIGTIQDFIGQERDFVILLGLPAADLPTDGSPTRRTRSFDHKSSCDFLSNDHALQVAMTRARIGLFIIAGDEKSSPDGTCCESWLKLLDYYKLNKLCEFEVKASVEIMPLNDP